MTPEVAANCARLSRIASWAAAFEVATGPEAVAQGEQETALDPLGLVVSGEDLADTATGTAERLLQMHSQARGLEPSRHAASLVFQHYSHRVAGVAVAAWLGEGLLVDLRAAQCRMVVTDGIPTRLVLPTPTFLPTSPAPPTSPGLTEAAELADSAETLITAVVDRHLVPVARALHTVGGIGMPNLWGNIGASLAGACRHVSLQVDAEVVLAHGEALLSRRPELSRSGTFRMITGPCGPRVFFDRRSCCQWYAIPENDQFCSWCCHLPQEERTRRFQSIVAAEGSAR